MKKSLKERIEKYLAYKGDWVCGGEIQKLAMEVGYEAQNAGRRLRELAEDEVLEVEYRRAKNGTKVAWYRTKQPKQAVIYHIPELNRTLVTHP